MYLSGCTRQKPISSANSETFLHEELEADITKARSVMITFHLLVSRCCAQDLKDRRYSDTVGTVAMAV